VLSNNLANVTNGFRAEMSTFRSVPLQGTAPARACLRWRPPPAIRTPRPGPAHRPALDAMAMGNAWFAVQGLDGTEAYTRNGVFESRPKGQLVTSTGQAVLSDGGAPIDIPPESTISLGSTARDRQDRQPAPWPWGASSWSRPPDDPLVRGDDGLFRAARAMRCPTTPRPLVGLDRRLERELRRNHGRHDRRLAPVRAADEAAADRRNQRQSASQLLSMNG
jgi:flagellar basal-body rod protein FlgF